jgi:hypothetical protein
MHLSSSKFCVGKYSGKMNWLDQMRNNPAEVGTSKLRGFC